MAFFGDLWDSLIGNKSADASKAAAADTYQKQQQAGSTARQEFGQLGANYDPFVNTGRTANTGLQNLLMDPNSVRGLPGYQFAQGEGIQALDRSAAARGLLNSGRAAKDVMRFSTGLADQTYGNQFNRLLQGAQFGTGALGNQNQTVGQGINDQFQANLGSAGTIGQGNVAAATAQQQGLNNLLQAGTYLGGAALGRFGGNQQSSFGNQQDGNVKRFGWF